MTTEYLEVDVSLVAGESNYGVVLTYDNHVIGDVQAYQGSAIDFWGIYFSASTEGGQQNQYISMDPAIVGVVSQATIDK
jgi:hypothetical protein